MNMAVKAVMASHHCLAFLKDPINTTFNEDVVY